MAYYIDLFSPETYEAFSNSDRSVSGFRARHEGLAKRIIPGDTLVCYVTKLSRWVGLLTVDSGPYKDDSPIFTAENDPFTPRCFMRAEGSNTPSRVLLAHHSASVKV